MPETGRLALRTASLVLMSAGYLALATTAHYGPSVLIVPLIFIPLGFVGEHLDERFRWYRRVTSGVTVLVGALLVFLWEITGVLSLVDTVAALVMYIQVHMLMHKKSVKNYHYLFLMSFFVLLVACVLSPEAGIGLAMVVFMVSAACALMALQAYAESTTTRSIASPAIAPVEAKGRHDVSEMPSLFDVRTVLTITLGCVALVLLAAVFFIVTPRFEAGLLAVTSPGVARTGLTQTVDLTASGLITQDRTAVMCVEFPEEPELRYDGPMLWRCTTLCDYEDGAWQRRSRVSTHMGDNLPRPNLRETTMPYSSTTIGVVRNPKGTGRLVKQSIYMDNVPVEGVPALSLVLGLRCTDNLRGIELSWDEMGDYTVKLKRVGGRRLEYEAWSEIDQFTPEQLRRAPDNYREVMMWYDYAPLTRHQLQPRTVELADEITASENDVYDKVIAIQRWLEGQGEFAYTLNLPQLDPEFPIDDFIHNTKRGHCELFASAMTLMVRSLGIPARVVSGFRGAEWNAGDQSYLVRAHMAHLWVEVYFLNRGWVTFDPSPMAEETTGLLGAGGLADWLGHYTLKTKMLWFRHVVGYDQVIQLSTLRTTAGRLSGVGADIVQALREIQVSGRVPRVPAVFLFVLAGLAAIVLTVRAILRKNRKPRYRLTSDQLRAVRLYNRLRRKLARAGVDCRNKTAEELAGDAARNPGIDSAETVKLITVYNITRFGNRPLPREEYLRLRKNAGYVQLAKR